MIPLSGDIPSAKGSVCEKIDSNSIVRGTSTLKRGFAHMLKNGVDNPYEEIMDEMIAMFKENKYFFERRSKQIVSFHYSKNPHI